MVEARFGRIVGLGSVAARTGVSGGALYAAGKAALEGLLRGIALDYSRRGVTANVVSIAFADTERLQGRVASDPAARERIERATATRRIPTPEEIADVVAFLCSPRASAITGAVVDATAGGHLNNLW
jgi:NAD(P)-dependent dehydrogenase (short-subunit alcohol dehydrogenase family)